MTAKEIAQYYLLRASEDGDLITNLKMQKLIYYAYAWTLVRQDKQLFNEPIEAWPNGPVVRSLYQDLKDYGSMPIGDDYLPSNTQALITRMSINGVKDNLDAVYEEYMTKAAFELVALTHSESPWVNARRGKTATEVSNEPIKDADIRATYHD
jgi:uncharacterized phage-associated protein